MAGANETTVIPGQAAAPTEPLAPAAPAEEPTPQETPSAEEQVPAEDDALRQRATAAGLSDKDYDSLGDTAELFLDRLDARSTELDRQVATSGRALLQQETPPQGLPAAPPQQVPQTPAAPTTPAFSLKLDQEALDAEMYGPMKTLADQVSVLSEGFQAMQQLSARMERQDMQRKQNEFEARITGLGEEYHSLLGAGRSESLHLDSPELQTRRVVLDHMDALEAGFAQRGIQLSEDDLFTRAIRVVAFDNNAAAARRAVQDEVVQRGSQIVHRPSGRRAGATAPPEKSKAAARAAVEKLKHDRGIGQE